MVENGSVHACHMYTKLHSHQGYAGWVDTVYSTHTPKQQIYDCAVITDCTVRIVLILHTVYIT